MIPRRTFLTAAGILLAASSSGRAKTAPRLAAIDWAMMETAIALGHMPVAGAELIRYRADVAQPVIPPEVVDLGLRGSPNFELLQLVQPDLVLSSPYYARYEQRLRAIAPVLSLSFFVRGEPPLPRAFAALADMAQAIDTPSAGVRDAANLELDRIAARLARYHDRPVALIDIGDARHMRIFGYDSLFGATLLRLGLTNARQGSTAFGFMAPVPLDALAEMPDARVVVIGSPPMAARRALSRSILWRALPPVGNDRVYLLPGLNPFGAIPTALRFASELERALTSGPTTIA